MPPSALVELLALQVSYPMHFKLTNPKNKQHTHVGVLEFVADPGRVYVPHWIMQTLHLEQGDQVMIEELFLTAATDAKFQPISVDFLNISDPRAVLESSLCKYACLTVGDFISIDYNDKVYKFRVVETNPGRAVTIIEVDLNVTFYKPAGYVEPKKPPAVEPEVMFDPSQFINSTFYAFKGEGKRVDGKEIPDDHAVKPNIDYIRGVPDNEANICELIFDRNVIPKGNSNDDDEVNRFKAFQGEGKVLKN